MRQSLVQNNVNQWVARWSRHSQVGRDPKKFGNPCSKRFGDSSFSVSRATVWNNLLDHVKTFQSSSTLIFLNSYLTDINLKVICSAIRPWLIFGAIQIILIIIIIIIDNYFRPD